MTAKFRHIKSKEGFIDRAKQKHNNFYDYSLVEFEERGYGYNQFGNKTRKLPEYYGEKTIIILCPKHGNFNQRARKHLEGSGCKSCAVEVTTGVIIDKAKIANHINSNDYEVLEDHICILAKDSEGSKRVLISKEDEEILEYTNWYTTGHQLSRKGRTSYCIGSRTSRIKKEGYDWLSKSPPIHRLIASRVVGRRLREGEQIDHINGNGLDNRRENLRLATRTQNQASRRKQRTISGKKTSSVYKGVCLPSHAVGKCKAYIGSRQARKYLGTFNLSEGGEKIAAMEYDKAAIKLWGEFAELNFPEKLEEYLAEVGKEKG